MEEFITQIIAYDKQARERLAERQEALHHVYESLEQEKQAMAIQYADSESDALAQLEASLKQELETVRSACALQEETQCEQLRKRMTATSTLAAEIAERIVNSLQEAV